jgi:hypothetical protein
LKFGAQYRAALIGGLIAFSIHLLLVLGVLYLDLTDVTRQAITVWNYIADLDFCVSAIIYWINPRYGVETAVAFGILGGLQWFLTASILVWFWKREDRLKSG